MKKLLLLLFTIAFLFVEKASSQEDTHVHHLERYEIGISNGIVYSFNEKEFAYGLHLHFIKNFGEEKKIGVGLGYEAIFDEHKHSAMSVLLHYKPTNHIDINVAPGVIFLNSEIENSRFALHLEGVYHFELGFIHYGPMIATAISADDVHASIGLHVAIGF
ncbi:MAG TPA: hypothetical protein P5132_10615 [Bacteroidales bacterium]|nr:hypothetical protein [Bacteroidales bacterium]